MANFFKGLNVALRSPRYALDALFWRTLFWPFVQWHGIQAGERVRFIGMPMVKRARGGSIKIGVGTRIVSCSRYTALGTSHSTILNVMAAGARIEIGKKSGISGAVICAKESVVIEDMVLIGSGAIICDTDFHSLDPETRVGPDDFKCAVAAPVVIRANAFIGARAIILKGVTVGECSIVGAGAVVSRDVPPINVFAGNTAQVIKTNQV